MINEIEINNFLAYSREIRSCSMVMEINDQYGQLPV